MKRLLPVLAALCVLQGCTQPSPGTRQPVALDSASQQVMSDAKRPFSNLTIRADESEAYAMPDGIVAASVPVLDQEADAKADGSDEEVPAPHEEAAVSLVHVSTDQAPDKVELAPARQDEPAASDAANPESDPQHIATPVFAPTRAAVVPINNAIARKPKPKRADVILAEKPRPAPKAKLQMAPKVARADAARTLHRMAAMPAAEKSRKSSKPRRELSTSELRVFGGAGTGVNRRGEEDLEPGRRRGVPEVMLVTYQ